MTGSDIISTLDNLLQDDKNMDTRAGLRLYAELVRDAFRYIESEKSKQEERTQVQNSIITRITHVENGLNDFLKMREKEQEKAQVERERWRWAILGPMIVIILNELPSLFEKIVSIFR